MARREGAPPQELSGLQFYNQRRSQKGRKPLSSSFLSRCHASIVSSSSMSGGGVFLSLHGQDTKTGTMTVVTLWKNYLGSQYTEDLAL